MKIMKKMMMMMILEQCLVQNSQEYCNDNNQYSQLTLSHSNNSPLIIRPTLRCLYKINNLPLLSLHLFLTIKLRKNLTLPLKASFTQGTTAAMGNFNQL